MASEPSNLSAARKRAWDLAHNKRRKKAYQQDPNYRESVLKTNRAAYAEGKGGLKAVISGAANVGCESACGSKRLIGGEEQVSFSAEEIGILLGGYDVQVVYRMQRDGRLPRPNTETNRKGNFVYTLPQAQRLLAVMVEHQKSKAYFNLTDTDTIDALKKAMENEPNTNPT